MCTQNTVILIVVVLVILYFLNKQGMLPLEGFTMTNYGVPATIAATAKVPIAALNKLKKITTEGMFSNPMTLGRPLATVIPGARTRVSSQGSF